MARVLIVDDEPRIRDLIREHLQYAGFTCAEAGDGTQALAELAEPSAQFPEVAVFRDSIQASTRGITR